MIQRIKTHRFLKHIHKVAPGHLRQKISRNLDEVHSVGIVLDGSDPDSIRFSKAWADEAILNGKSVELLAYVPKKDKEVSYSLPFFTNDDTNWYYLPVATHIRKFMERSFDLLINLSPDRILPLEYVCALSSSQFIIGNGVNHLNGYYDCLIKVNDSRSPARFMENVRHYLNLQA